MILIGCVMLFLAGVRLRYFAALAVLGAARPLPRRHVAAYRRDRIEAYLNPWSDARGSGYQIIQSLIAVGTGGLSGVGLWRAGRSSSTCPIRTATSSIAVIGEELGLLGAGAVVLGFVLLLWRGVRAAWKAPDAFGTFLAAGLTLSIVLQGLINVSVVLGLLPTKGIPLPFISAGGSSLLFTLVSVGLLLNITQHAD